MEGRTVGVSSDDSPAFGMGSFALFSFLVSRLSLGQVALGGFAALICNSECLIVLIDPREVKPPR